MLTRLLVDMCVLVLHCLVGFGWITLWVWWLVIVVYWLLVCLFVVISFDYKIVIM